MNKNKKTRPVWRYVTQYEIVRPGDKIRVGAAWRLVEKEAPEMMNKPYLDYLPRIKRLHTEPSPPEAMPQCIDVNNFGKVERFHARGIGEYPYECNAQDTHPGSMIYHSPWGWLASHTIFKREETNGFDPMAGKWESVWLV